MEQRIVGCDTAALRGALSKEGRCVAVLPCGLDMVVPSVNEELAEEILDKGGCLISEYEAGTETEKYRFVQRDRLQSGLSEAVLVVHAGEVESRSDSFMSDLTSKSDAAATQNRKDSGSLKTAEFARKQG
ncbi:MAG: DNA-protecting protein DprA, partial [Lachnospiraceae bacterium]|nr:DNA-protecting protein DprA [Lachnospiraceae bacterium]